MTRVVGIRFQKAGKIYYVKVKALTKNGKISYSNVKSCRVKE